MWPHRVVVNRIKRKRIDWAIREHWLQITAQRLSRKKKAAMSPFSRTTKGSPLYNDLLITLRLLRYYLFLITPQSRFKWRRRPLLLSSLIPPLPRGLLPQITAASSSKVAVSSSSQKTWCISRQRSMLAVKVKIAVAGMTKREEQRVVASELTRQGKMQRMLSFVSYYQNEIQLHRCEVPVNSRSRESYTVISVWAISKTRLMLSYGRSLQAA